jgi:hypothetical protein
VHNVTTGLDQLEVAALRAAFAPRQTATEAWKAIRREHRFRTMPDPVARLCGQIYRNLGLKEGHSDRDRLRGAFKSNHVHGTFHLAGVLRALQELERNSIPYLIVKGAAVALHAKTFGVRRLGDIDVAVSIDNIERARRVLAGVGFEPKPPVPWHGRRRPCWWSCGPFVNHRGAKLDLMVSGTRHGDVIARLLRSPASPINWMGSRLRVASREQTLLVSLVHGYHAGAESDFIQSLADVLLLINDADLEELQNWAKQCRLGFMLDAAAGRLLDSGLLDRGRWPIAVGNAPHDRVSSRVRRLQGKYRPSLVATAWRLRRRWLGFSPPFNVPRGLSPRTVAYRAWLVGLRIAVIERLLLRGLGSLVPDVRILRPACGETLVMEAAPSAWDFRFRIEWSGEEEYAVSLTSDFDPADGRLLPVYESGRCRGTLPGPGANPLVLHPAEGRRGVEVSIRLLEHRWPEQVVRCWVTLLRA